jgi:hypothetical protein
MPIDFEVDISEDGGYCPDNLIELLYHEFQAPN